MRSVLGDVEKNADTEEDEQLSPEEHVLGPDGLGPGGASVADAPHDDPRTMNQARADVMMDLLLAASSETVTASGAEAVQGRVQVTLPAAVLAGSSNAPAHVEGCGPVDPELAREIAALAPGWDRLYIDECSGMVTATDRYRPTSGMRRFLKARDGRCRFPGCAAAAHRCDLDHNDEYSRGGTTSCGYLGHLRRRHHSLKHPDLDARYRWSARQLSAPRRADRVDQPEW